jgi:hypothetical protein
MHPKIEVKINLYQQAIKNMIETEEDLILAERFVPEANIWIDNEVNVIWRVTDFKQVKDVLKLFAQEGIFIESFVKSDTCPVWYLQGKRVKIRLCPSWSSEDVEGATCKLVQVDVEMIKRPIYKLICKELEDEAS